MKVVFHGDLTQERWNQFSTIEQMGNIGSEVGRAMKARTAGDKEREEGALYRGLELFDLTVDDPKNKARLKEILRAREAWLDYFVGNNEYCSTAEQWEKYFLDFAIAARQGR